jgi:anthranilate phosphoribosyltransferase
MSSHHDSEPELVKEFLDNLLAKIDLTPNQMNRVIDLIASDKLSPAQISALLVALKSKGETSLEIATAAMRMKSIIKQLNIDLPFLMDICGTGGDFRNTFNISTASMFVIAGAGGHVAKHGSGAISSASGSADLLRALGVNLDLPSDKILEGLHKTGLGFFLSPNFHSIWEKVGQARYEIGIRTLFNILGPLANPANIKYQIIGTYDQNLIKPIIESLGIMGLKQALVVSADNGMDEISLEGKTRYAELRDGVIKYEYFDPKELGFSAYSRHEYFEQIVVIDALDSKDKVLKALNSDGGIVQQTIVLNAGAGIYISNNASSLAEGIDMAERSIRSGAAMRSLKKFVSYTRGEL